MVRKQVYIAPEHDALLKRRAKELRVTEAELIRRGIEQLAAGRRGLRPVADSQAWADLKAFITQHRLLGVPQTGRTWTRDDLYDERLRRFSG